MSGQQRANDSVARRFSRTMRASTSRWGSFTDPLLTVLSMIAVASIMVLLQRFVLPQRTLSELLPVALVPATCALVATITTLNGRQRVVDWLASMPFPVDNMNALLNGVGQHLSVHFSDTAPKRETINEALERIHPDCFVLEYGEDETSVEVRIGVLDSKMNPSRANFHRFQRVQRLVADALVPLSEEFPITRIWIC